MEVMSKHLQAYRYDCIEHVFICSRAREQIQNLRSNVDVQRLSKSYCP